MDEQAAPISEHPWREDLARIGLLLLLVIALRVWMLTHTVVAARDCIGYIRYALEFEKYLVDEQLDLWQTWHKALNKNHQHPGYPLAVLAMSAPVRHVRGGIDAEGMQLSAQLASNLAAVLLIVPTFYIGKVLFNRQVAFWGALLFQFLPVTSHLLSDGISEPLFLLFTCSALLMAMQALRERSTWRWAFCGVFGGLSYLTRPEGALVIVAAYLVLAGVQAVRAQRWPWRSWASACAALVLPAVAVASVYVAATGKFTNKPSLTRIINQDQHQILPMRTESSGRWHTDCACYFAKHCLVGSLWAAYIKPDGSVFDRLGRGVFALFMEVAQGFHYFGGLFVLLGCVWYGKRLLTNPATWIYLALAGLHVALLLSLVVSVWYVSDRHVQILVLGGCFLLAATLLELPATLAGWWSRFRARQELKLPAVWSTVPLLLLVALCLPKTLQPLHHNRLGHVRAGVWLAGRVHAGDVVDDDHCWAHFYAGKVFEEGRVPAPAPGHQPVCYIVVTRSRDEDIDRTRSAHEAKIRAAQGELVYAWPADAAKARVVVYALPRAACGPFLRSP